MDQDVQDYVDAIPDAQRPLFDRMHDLILSVHPDAEILISYKMPTYKVGDRRLYLAAWAHGVSLYGWQADHDGGFSARHPELTSGRGTIRIRPEDAAELSDAELTTLVRAALDD